MALEKDKVDILCQEFSDEFDVLYNNISSNQAPGLDQYEKSLFLTRAQDEIVKSYFSPYLNRLQAGYDMNERRQVDFSMITKSKVFDNFIHITYDENKIEEGILSWDKSPVKLATTLLPNRTPFGIRSIDYNSKSIVISPIGELVHMEPLKEFSGLIDTNAHYFEINKDVLTLYKPVLIDKLKPFDNPVFDLRDNTRSIIVDEDILMLINEYVEVMRDNKRKRLTVAPIQYGEYTRLMTKPYKRPTKNQAWRLIDNADGSKRSELIIGPTDVLDKYVIRYVKRPQAIILDDFGEDPQTSDVTINGQCRKQACELDPILYPEIIQRAVELAWAAYKEPSLSNQLSIGSMSETNMGVSTPGGNNDRRQQQ